MKHVELRKHKDIFLDYGSGMGRVLIMAAAYPFRKVIGVELSGKLNKVAFENIKRVKKKLKCKDIEIVEADATTYRVPTEVTVIYFYNPFTGAILQQVVDNIHKSLVEAPRKLTIDSLQKPCPFRNGRKEPRLVVQTCRTVQTCQIYPLFEAKEVCHLRNKN